MSRKIAARARTEDGRAAYYPTVLWWAVDKIMVASADGHGAYLTAEEIRALDYANIREDGNVPTDCWRDHPFEDSAP